MSTRIEEAPYDDQRVQRLVDQVQAEYVERYGGPDESPMEVSTFAPPTGRFFVVLRDDELERRRGQEALRQITATVAVRRAAKVESREIEEIEHVEDRRMLRVGRRDLAFGPGLHAVLDRVERRLAARVERDELAVEDHAIDRLAFQLFGELRKRMRQLVSAPRKHAHAFRVDVRDHAIAVELRFPHPCGIVERLAAELGISYSTVHRHIESIYRKLHVHSRSHAVAKYLGA